MKKYLALLLAFCCAITAAIPPAAQAAEVNFDLSGTYDITMWVSEMNGVAELFRQQIDAFEAANPGIVINAAIEGVTEADAGSKVVADVAAAPDIYCFAQDQLARLVQAGALAAPDSATALTAANDSGSVAAASVAGTIYAYPMTSDNGYYMYYDTSIISPEEAESLESIIAACEANNVLFRYALQNAWYTASFFFATGCHSNWIMNETGEFIAVDDDFNSPAGLIAMKGMEKLAKSSCYDSNADIFTGAGVVITGLWNYCAAAEHFGANLGATDLPSFEVDGQSYHPGSFTGNKLMGVKPQSDAKKAAVLSLLAQYLTGEECQMQRYEKFQWGPSNRNAQASDAVQADRSLAALLKQNEYGTPQGQIHGSWWDIAKMLGWDAKIAESEADLQTALDNYKTTIDGLFSMTEEQKNAWSVIGSICGTSWDTDFPMTETYPGVYVSDVLELYAGDEFKVRQGVSWDMNFGVEFNGANIVVEEDGLYRVQLVWDGGMEGTVSLIREGEPIELGGTCGENLSWTLANGVLTISGTGKMDDYDDDPWTETPNAPWYAYRHYIQTVVIGSGVTTIGDDAFYDCDFLTSVTIPESVTSIGIAAFSGCTALTSATIPEGVTHIGSSAFSGCSSLTSISIPGSVTYIGIGAFNYCTGLTSFTVANANTSFCTDEYGVLFNTDKTRLICYPAGSRTTYAIPEYVTEIGESAFHGCTSLTSVTVPESVTEIGESAFYGCTSLTSISIPEGITSIDNRAFEYCSSLTSISIPESVTFIGIEAFSRCDSLTSVTIPENVTFIDAFAFFACGNLASITIPTSVTSIGEHAFYYCYSLTDVYYAGSEAQWANISMHLWDDDALSSATIHYNYVPVLLSGLVIDANGTWWYYENGVLQTGYTGLVYFNDAFFYVENGALNAGYTGLVYFADTFYYVEGGVLNFGYTGLVYFAGAFYYVENGVLNFGYTGLVYFAGVFYYVENGVLNFGYTGLVYFAGVFYYVENGILNFGYTGLVYFADVFYYVENGILNWGYTGLVWFYDVWYYVNSGILDFSYSGTAFTPDGTMYNVIGGVAQP